MRNAPSIRLQRGIALVEVAFDVGEELPVSSAVRIALWGVRPRAVW